jgi:hypothetical protein
MRPRSELYPWQHSQSTVIHDGEDIQNVGAVKMCGYSIAMERGLMMVFHSIVIGIILYLIMLYGLGQRSTVAENRSVLAAAGVLIYMVLFGHGLPNKLNRDL